jgi:hypothetical protein
MSAACAAIETFLDFQPPTEPPIGELASIRKAAEILGINTSTVHRWLNDGFVAGEQLTPGAPWQIRITDELRARFVEQAPADYLPMLEATVIECVEPSLPTLLGRQV